jgi:hypothetical protein
VQTGPSTQTGQTGQPARPGPGGRELWFAGGDLDPQLGLGRLRTRWAAGRAGAAPGPDLFDGADARQVYAYAAAVAQRAAGDLRAARGRDRAGIAWAAADLITSAAEATGNPELRRAADGFRRAARAPWGRAPSARSPAGAMIRTAAYAIAGCAPVDRRSAVRRALIAALTLLVKAVAEMRRERMLREQARRVREERARQLRAAARDPQAPGRQPQVRSLQAEDAARAATGFARAAGPTWGATDPAAAAAAAASQSAPGSRPAAATPARRRPSASR